MVRVRLRDLKTRGCAKTKSKPSEAGSVWKGGARERADDVILQKNNVGAKRTLLRRGPSDRIRTCGIVVPNHARYQLRYTRLFKFASTALTV